MFEVKPFVIGLMLVVVFSICLRLVGLIEICRRMVDSSKKAAHDLRDSTKSDLEKENIARAVSLLLLRISGLIVLRLTGAFIVPVTLGLLCVIMGIIDYPRMIEALSNWITILVGSAICIIVFRY
jgi:hypothetical protein